MEGQGGGERGGKGAACLYVKYICKYLIRSPRVFLQLSFSGVRAVNIELGIMGWERGTGNGATGHRITKSP